MRTPHIFALALAAGAIPIAAQAEAREAAVAGTETNAIVGSALYVTDMARSLVFYRDVLGMTVRMQFGPTDRPDVVLGFGDDPGGSSLMLLSDRAGPAPSGIEHGHGYDRFAIRAASLPALQAKLRAAGFKAGEIEEAHGTLLVMMATDPDGYAVELIDSKPSGEGKAPQEPSLTR
jgi:catechol 2,3-dioxygenase-like lactoylglutathione lyase family enzyme